MNKFTLITFLAVMAIVICNARVIDQVHPDGENGPLSNMELEDSFSRVAGENDNNNQDLNRQKRFIKVVKVIGGNTGYRSYGYGPYRGSYYGGYNRGYGRYGYGGGYRNYGGYGNYGYYG